MSQTQAMLQHFMITLLIVSFMIALSSWSLTSAQTKELSSRVVHTKYGTIRGYMKSFANSSLQAVEVYRGIPYAGPPVGPLRFMPPVTPLPWERVLIADRLAHVCPQFLPWMFNQSLSASRLGALRRLIAFLREESEDCLYLNVYVPMSCGTEGFIRREIAAIDNVCCQDKTLGIDSKNV